MNTASPNPGDDADANNALEEMVDDAEIEQDLPDPNALSLDPTQDPTIPPNLREISSLASWQVSSAKPGCGVEALRSHLAKDYWQSDGPQPHKLTIHFNKFVKICKMRVYLDFGEDESYTPTRMAFYGGTGHHDLTLLSEWHGEGPRGWIDVDLQGVGIGGSNEARVMIVQLCVLENHQNGKDTHVRGVQIFSKDDRIPQTRRIGGEEIGDSDDVEEGEASGLTEPDWMGEPIIR